ncbi:MAG TPA: alpha/beta hydrolase [Phototrophicaceae bacterium]|nr:alpha/beta hydrolase [Phototrophicaceae bacterium]
MPYPLYDFGGDGPIIHFAIANGFPPPTYAPLLKPLTAHYHVISLLPRALWPNEPPPEQWLDWQIVADDLLAGLAYHGLENVIAFGHSFGAIASLLAALAEPKRFRGLGLLDPVIFLPAVSETVAAMQANNLAQDFPLVQGALRRRARFATTTEAFAYFRTKTLFLDWSDDYLRRYVEHGTRPAQDGDGLELVWPPEWEAYYFGTLYTKTWARLPHLRGLLPLLIVRGADSDTLLADVAAEVLALLPDMTYAEIAQRGHLFPLSAPTETRQVMKSWLAGLD